MPQIAGAQPAAREDLFVDDGVAIVAVNHFRTPNDYLAGPPRWQAVEIFIHDRNIWSGNGPYGSRLAFEGWKTVAGNLGRRLGHSVSLDERHAECAFHVRHQWLRHRR